MGGAGKIRKNTVQRARVDRMPFNFESIESICREIDTQVKMNHNCTKSKQINWKML